MISDGPDAGELTEEPIAGGRTLDWRVSESGEFAARVRGCRTTPTGFYCGPFSNAVNVVTFVPDTPVELRGQQTANGLQLVQWKPGPRTPNSVRYEVAFGRYGTIPCSTRFTRCGGLGDRQYDQYVDDVDHDHARAVARFERGCVSSSFVFDSRVLGVHVAAGPGKYRNAGLPDGSDASAATPTFGGPPTPATLAMARK